MLSFFIKSHIQKLSLVGLLLFKIFHAHLEFSQIYCFSMLSYQYIDDLLFEIILHVLFIKSSQAF